MSRRAILGALTAVGLFLAGLPSTAQSAYPGSNGKIAFVSDRDDPFGGIYTMNADGSAVTRVDIGRTIESPAWSPDGTKLAFGSKRDGFDDIFVLEIASGSLTRLTTGPDTDFEPTWSPDASKIAFVSDRDGNNEIYVMNADGSDQRRLTNNPESDDDPQWSPKVGDDRIAFDSSRDGHFLEVYVMDAADGGNVSPIVPPGSISDGASWSPDGSKIAFRSQGDIYTVDLATGDRQQLTDNPAQDFEPAWSPNGNRVAFVSFRDGNAEVYVMDADGANQTRLTNNGAIDFEPDWQSLPPPPPPPGACITLSETSVSVAGGASTPSHRSLFGTDPDRLTVTNCGTSPVHLAARGTDANGTAGTWQLVDSGTGSVCELGVNLFHAGLALLLPAGGVGIGLETRDRLLVGGDGATPFTLAAAAAQDISPSVEMPCVGSIGLGDPMTFNVTVTAVAP